MNNGNFTDRSFTSYAGVGSFSPMFSESVQAKKMFHARVTELLADGYTIETVIDGKPLRGVLFSNKPTAFHLSHQSSGRSEDGCLEFFNHCHTSIVQRNCFACRKRASSEIGPITSDGDRSNKKSVPQRVAQDLANQGQAGGSVEKNSEVVAASPLAPKIAEASGASASNEVN